MTNHRLAAPKNMPVPEHQTPQRVPAQATNQSRQASFCMPNGLSFCPRCGCTNPGPVCPNCRHRECPTCGER